MKNLLKRPETLLVVLGLLFIAGAVLVGAFYDEKPETAQVIYVSDEDKDRLSAEVSAQDVLININTATAEELQQLEGIGEGISRDIIEYREKNGKFESTEQLLCIKGIGEEKYNDIRHYVTVD